jgi:hypothetical protein
MHIEEARVALIWGHKLYRNGVLVLIGLTPTPSLACKYSSIKNKFRKNRGMGPLGCLFFFLWACANSLRG